MMMKARVREAWSVSLQLTLIFMILYLYLSVCFMTNIKVTNMKNTAGKSARVYPHLLAYWPFFFIVYVHYQTEISDMNDDDIDF